MNSSYILGVVVVVMTAAAAFAHDPGLSSSRVSTDGAAIVVKALLDDADAAYAVPKADVDGDGHLSLDEVEAAREHMNAFASTAFRVDGSELADGVRVAVSAGSDIEFLVRFRASAVAAKHVLSASLFSRLPRGHYHFARVVDTAGRSVQARVLSAFAFQHRD